MKRLFQPRRDPFWDPWHYVLQELGKMNDGARTGPAVPHDPQAVMLRKDRHAR